jgi:hypothetical protein
VLDETSKAGPRVQPSNHSEDGKHWSMGHHIPFKLKEGKDCNTKLYT